MSRMVSWHSSCKTFWSKLAWVSPVSPVASACNSYLRPSREPERLTKGEFWACRQWTVLQGMVPLVRTLALLRLFVRLCICFWREIVWTAPRHIRSVPAIHLTSRLLIESTRGQKLLNIRSSAFARNPGLGNAEFLRKSAFRSRQTATAVTSFLIHVAKWTIIPARGPKQCAVRVLKSKEQGGKDLKSSVAAS